MLAPTSGVHAQARQCLHRCMHFDSLRCEQDTPFGNLPMRRCAVDFRQRRCIQCQRLDVFGHAWVQDVRLPTFGSFKSCRAVLVLGQHVKSMGQDGFRYCLQCHLCCIGCTRRGGAALSVLKKSCRRHAVCSSTAGSGLRTSRTWARDVVVASVMRPFRSKPRCRRLQKRRQAWHTEQTSRA